MVNEKGYCKKDELMKAALAAAGEKAKACRAMRQDGAFIEAGEQDNLIVQKLQEDPNAFGIFGFSYLDQNSDTLQGAIIDGGAPTFEAIAEGSYSVSRALYFYVKHAHMGVVPGMEEYMAEWVKHWGEDGRVSNVESLKQQIFRGGVDPPLRIEVWKFLLGYYDYASTTKERQDKRGTRVDDYFRMKLQWKSLSPDQESRFSALKERKALIEKDVNRTDRTHVFFQGEKNPNLDVLSDVLMTYVMYNFDLGYVQGMSDLLAPVLVVMENEVDAFWCFVGFMELIGRNFEMDQSTMKHQMIQVRKG